MKIAVTCCEGEVFQHFGHTPEFAMFEVEDHRIVKEELLPCGDSGHGALATLLAEQGVQLLICGGIGGGAVNALDEAGIEVVRGAEGPVRAVAEAFLRGTLVLRDEGLCSHHHGEGGHHCGEHSCGGGSCGH